MLGELIRAFLLIFLAEMGDKTQIIAMTFATKFKVRDVINGVIIGVMLNHGIAIILGRFISNTLPLETIQIFAGIIFVIFGIMSLKDDELETTDEKKNFGPIISVALAFFIGELGDKTQLTAMTLASEASFPLVILLGTTLGMVATSGLGIFIGSRIGEKIPEVSIKILSSIVFIGFGTLRLYTKLPKIYINQLNVIFYLTILALVEIVLITRLLKNRKLEQNSSFKEAASRLHSQTSSLNHTLDSICLTPSKCGKCIGPDCLIGYTRFILKEARESGNYYEKAIVDIDSLVKKEYDINIVAEALAMIIAEFVEYNWENNKAFVIVKVKTALELLIFEKKLSANKELKKYLKEAKSKNRLYGSLLESEVYKNLAILKAI